MPDITKQPYKNIIEVYTKLKVLDPIKLAIEKINVHNKSEYTKIFENCKSIQTGGTPEDQLNKITIKLNDNKFIFNSHHMDYLVFYNLLTPNEEACITIEINKNTHIAHIESIQFNEKCFSKYAAAKSGSILLKACEKLIDTVKNRYKLKYIWLLDISEKRCEKVKNVIRLWAFYMLVHGNTWYSKYGYLPFDHIKKETDKWILSDLNINKKIVTTTLVKNTQIKKIILNAIDKYDLNFDKNKIKQIIKKYEDETVIKFFNDSVKEFDLACELFYYIYQDVMMSLNMKNMYDVRYWKKL